MHLRKELDSEEVIRERRSGDYPLLALTILL
jgi:hypothetical protein